MEIIFIHGLGQTDTSWEQVTKELPCPCHCPNLKELLEAEEVTFSNLYDVFEEYCHSFSGKLHLCGISLGGMLALKYAIEHPEKVESLVLIGVQYKIPPLLFAVQGLVFQLLPSGLFGDVGFDKKDFISLTKSMKTLDFSDELHKITGKVFLICGEKDKANIKATYQLTEKLHGSVTIIEKSNHEVNVDAPKELSRVLMKFFELI